MPGAPVVAAELGSTMASALQEIELVFKTYGEVIDVHVISGERLPGLPLAAAAGLSLGPAPNDKAFVD